MKILFILTLTALTSFAQANCNPEAMFIGTVTNLTQTDAGFTYQVSLGHQGNYFFSASGVCPMYEPELEAAVIVETGLATISNGDMVSGVMVQDETTGAFHVE